jgi:hypothetical protein
VSIYCKYILQALLCKLMIFLNGVGCFCELDLLEVD